MPRPAKCLVQFEDGSKPIDLLINGTGKVVADALLAEARKLDNSPVTKPDERRSMAETLLAILGFAAQEIMRDVAGFDCAAMRKRLSAHVHSHHRL